MHGFTTIIKINIIGSIGSLIRILNKHCQYRKNISLKWYVIGVPFQENGEEEIESIVKGIDSGITEEVSQDNKSDGEIETEKDRAKLLQFLNTTRLDLEESNKIIEGFDVNFDLDTLSVQIYCDGYSMHVERGQYEL